MRRPNIILVAMVFMAMISLSFQNCARPVRSKKPEEVQLPSTLIDDTNPGLDRTEGTEVPLIGEASPVFSSSKYAGTGQDEKAHGIFPTSDGGYITTGRLREHTSAGSLYDVLFQKYDSQGELEYSVDVGDQYNNEGLHTIELLDSYLVVGTTTSRLETTDPQRQNDILLMKLNKADGDIILAKRLGDEDSVERISDVVTINTENGPQLLAAGYVRSGNRTRGFLLRFDPFLEIIWQRDFGHNNNNISLEALTYHPSHGIFAVGSWWNSNTERNSLMMRFTESGTVTRASYFDDPLNTADELIAIENSGFDLVAVGQYRGTRGGDGLIFRFDYNGQPTEAHLIGSPSVRDSLSGVKITRDGGLILGGLSRANGSGDDDSWVTKLSNNNLVQFSKLYGGAGAEYANYQPIVTRTDGGYAFMTNEAQGANSDVFDPRLLLLDQFGNISTTCSRRRGNANISRVAFSPFEFRTITTAVQGDQNTGSFVDDVILDSSENELSLELAVESNQYCTQ